MPVVDLNRAGFTNVGALGAKLCKSFLKTHQELQKKIIS